MAKAVFLKPSAGGKDRNIVRDFIYGCWCNGKRVGGMSMPPLHELMAATHARQDGLEILFVDAQYEPERFAALERQRFDGVIAICMMSSTQSFRQDLEVIRAIKQLNPKVKSVLYGSHPTFMPNFCLKEPEVDFIATREAEESLRELLGALLNGDNWEGIAGIGWRDADGKPQMSPTRAFANMNDLPIPDRRLLPAKVDYFNPMVKRVPFTTMITSRGCPARCNYCTAPTFYGNKTRARSTAKIIEELREIRDLGYREIFFRDETFSAYKGRNMQVYETMLSENLDFTWIANGRVDMIDREQLALMKRAGCHTLKFGVETGSQMMLDTYKKGTTIEQAVEAFRTAREVGINTHAHIIFGGPGETLDTIRHTVDFVSNTLKATTATFGILTPYPGTELFDMVAERHPEIMDGSASNMENLHTESFYSSALCDIPPETLSKEIVRAYRGFYLRPAYLLHKLRLISSIEEFMVNVIAGLNVVSFAVSGKK
ncbi:B12-binding domain-containing radical SAM protein [Paramagnetospirillum magneticum]|uniref:Fe-S oxidoreductase n=1 Tax=Paramagnetospirillum magneticum (strain ATCC 700264 / AMB-1) TaxID=342108 RepID=Q2WB53_PARM1|nr:radical SAM protein [Paramagnetospirillum magneticum]BAE48922.1 Fe-S oxidoreductase [Paramagnetospirillum magneticum AMB-1]